MSQVLEVVVVLRGVEEIPDEEHEQVTGRVCAIDVAKESGKVCTRVPHETQPGGRVCKVWDVDCGCRKPVPPGQMCPLALVARPGALPGWQVLAGPEVG